MERRSSLRKPIHLDAMVCLQNGATWPCVIADYCSEGMLLKYSLSASSAIEASVAEDSLALIKVKFKSKSGQLVDVDAHPVHRMKGAAGIQFEVPRKDVAKVLLELSDSDNCKIDEQEVKHIIHECTDAITNYTMPLIKDLLPKIFESIKASAVKASTDQIANMTMEAANQLFRDQGKLTQSFMVGIQDPIGNLHPEAEGKIAVEGRLAVIEKGEFEDWLTTRVMTTKAETKYREHLLPLKMRLDAAGLADKKHHQSPFGPALLVSAFQSGISHFGFDNSIEKLVFNLFESEVMNGLEGLYEELNNILISHGLLPELDLKAQIKKTVKAEPPSTSREEELEPQEDDSPNTQSKPSHQSGTGARSSTRARSGTGAGGNHSSGQAASTTVPSTASESPAGSGTPIVDELQPSPFHYGGAAHGPAPSQPVEASVTVDQPPFASEVKNAGAGASSDGAVAHSEGEGFSHQNVMGLVKSLHGSQMEAQGVEAEGADVSGADISEAYSRSELSTGLSELQAASATDVTALEERVGLLDRVLDNLSSGAAGEKVIDQEQQVAIDVVDRFFGSLKGNPRLTNEAKKQLHRLEIPVLKVLLENENFFDDGDSSVRAVMNRIAQLGAKGTRLNPASQRRIESLVQQILAEFEQDTQVFDQALTELDQLVERQNTLYRKNVERVAAAAEGVYKVEEAKIYVAKAINERFKGKPVPKAISALVDSGWQELLDLVYIKHGEHSDEWQHSMGVIDELIQYSNDPTKKPDLKTLLPRIQNGLNQISCSADTLASVRNEMKKFIESAPTATHEVVVPKLREVPETELEITQRNLKKSSELKPWIIRAKSIQAGSWVQFNREDQETQYMRLVWIAKGYSKYVFVNHQGMKVVELGLFKFATYLKDNVIIPDPNYEVPIVNQGLDDMVKDVYDKLAYEASHDEDSSLPKKAEFCRQVRAIMKAGKRTSVCSMVFARFEPMSEEQEMSMRAEFAQQVAAILNDPGENIDKSVMRVAGRLSVSDFALFIVTDKVEDVQTYCRDKLLELCQSSLHDSTPLILGMGVSQAHLGFNNPESMIQHALKPIEDALHTIDEAEDVSAEVEPGEAEETEGLQETAELEPPTLSSLTEKVEIDEEQVHQEYSTALDEKEFEIYCQRAMALSDDSVHEEQYELISSEADSGISFEPQNDDHARALDQWWINLIVKKQKEIDPAWDSIDFMRIKLSGLAFSDDSFKDHLIALADAGEIEAGRIWFDLYDCSLIENIHAAADMMKHLMVKGFRFCLDNFGTGRSPFSLLKVLPVDLIKIDEEFLGKMNDEESDQSSADSIVEVAHYLGKEVVAGSVDSAICLQRMKKLGVDYVQGSTVSEYELLGPA